MGKKGWVNHINYFSEYEYHTNSITSNSLYFFVWFQSKWMSSNLLDTNQLCYIVLAMLSKCSMTNEWSWLSIVSNVYVECARYTFFNCCRLLKEYDVAVDFLIPPFLWRLSGSINHLCVTM